MGTRWVTAWAGATLRPGSLESSAEESNLSVREDAGLRIPSSAAIDLADPVVEGVGDVEVAGAVDGDGPGVVEVGVGGVAAVARELAASPAVTGTGDDGDGPSGLILAMRLLYGAAT